MNILLITLFIIKHIITCHIYKKDPVFQPIHSLFSIPVSRTNPLSVTGLAKLYRSSRETLQPTTKLPHYVRRTSTSKNRDSSSYTWDCEMWFANERMPSDMEEKATFGQAVAAVTSASSVFKLTYASAGMRLFSRWNSRGRGKRNGCFRYICEIELVIPYFAQFVQYQVVSFN